MPANAFNTQPGHFYGSTYVNAADTNKFTLDIDNQVVDIEGGVVNSGDTSQWLVDGVKLTPVKHYPEYDVEAPADAAERADAAFRTISGTTAGDYTWQNLSHVKPSATT